MTAPLSTLSQKNLKELYKILKADGIQDSIVTSLEGLEHAEILQSKIDIVRNLIWGFRHITLCKPVIHYCFIAGEQIAAKALRFKRSGDYCVIIWLGALKFPPKVSASASYAPHLAHELRLETRTPSFPLESPPRTAFEAYLGMAELEFGEASAKAKFVHFVMEYAALDFIVLHELGHIFHGHLRYLKKQYSVMSLTEGDATAGAPARQLTYQVLERDADTFAANWLIRRYLEAGARGYTGYLREVPYPFNINMLTVATHVLFKAYEYQFSTANLFKMKHPHPILRSLNVQASYPAYLRRKAQAPKGAYDGDYQRSDTVLACIDRAFVDLTGFVSPVDTELVREVDQKMYKTYAHKYAELYPVLMRLRHCVQELPPVPYEHL